MISYARTRTTKISRIQASTYVNNLFQDRNCCEMALSPSRFRLTFMFPQRINADVPKAYSLDPNLSHQPNYQSSCYQNQLRNPPHLSCIDEETCTSLKVLA